MTLNEGKPGQVLQRTREGFDHVTVLILQEGKICFIETYQRKPERRFLVEDIEKYAPFGFDDFGFADDYVVLDSL
jgi:hypothetical protein